MRILRLCVLLILALPLCAVKLIKYEIHNEQNKSVNITLSFDGVYNGKIDEKRDKEAVFLTLSGVSYPKEEIRAINSPLITKILLSPNPKENKTTLILQAKNDVRVNTQAINDNTGLMIRALDKNAPTNAGILSKQEPQKNSFEPKFDYTNYIFIVTLLFLLLGVLWWLSRSMRKGRNTKEFRVIFQRPLDRQNKFVVLEFGSKSYVMILGTSNVLLETIDKNDTPNVSTKPKPTEKKSPRSFENFFEENKERLQKLIKNKENSQQ